MKGAPAPYVRPEHMYEMVEPPDAAPNDGDVRAAQGARPSNMRREHTYDLASPTKSTSRASDDVRRSTNGAPQLLAAQDDSETESIHAYDLTGPVKSAPRASADAAGRRSTRVEPPTQGAAQDDDSEPESLHAYDLAGVVQRAPRASSTTTSRKSEEVRGSRRDVMVGKGRRSTHGVAIDAPPPQGGAPGDSEPASEHAYDLAASMRRSTLVERSPQGASDDSETESVHVYDLAAPTQSAPTASADAKGRRSTRLEPPQVAAADDSETESVHAYDLAGPVRRVTRADHSPQGASDDREPESAHVYDLAGPARRSTLMEPPRHTPDSEPDSEHAYELAGPVRKSALVEHTPQCAHNDSEPESQHAYDLADPRRSGEIVAATSFDRPLADGCVPMLCPFPAVLPLVCTTVRYIMLDDASAGVRTHALLTVLSRTLITRRHRDSSETESVHAYDLAGPLRRAPRASTHVAPNTKGQRSTRTKPPAQEASGDSDSEPESEHVYDLAWRSEKIAAEQGADQPFGDGCVPTLASFCSVL